MRGEDINQNNETNYLTSFREVGLLFASYNDGKILIYEHLQ